MLKYQWFVFLDTYTYYKMADEEYNKKVESLQQYIPFLDNMIAQLKDPSKKNREQQLSKMESLHSMITDRKKK